MLFSRKQFYFFLILQIYFFRISIKISQARIDDHSCRYEKPIHFMADRFLLRIR